MEVDDRDPVSGEKLTGHDWNGIKELDTPVPRGILVFLIVTHVFAVAWWFLMPTWPLGESYTKGLLQTDQRQSVEQKLVASAARRAVWTQRIESLSFDEIRADEDLMLYVRSTGRQLFGDNCAACHGMDGKGSANYPDLTDDDWLWGGDMDVIAQTVRVGVNAENTTSRLSEMPRFGADEMLPREDIDKAAAYIFSLSNSEYSTASNVATIEEGREIFLANCSTCHGEDARGKQDVGAPNLTDESWLYGGDLETIVETIHGGRRGHMPTWDQRLSEAEIKTLALYVYTLGIGGSQR